MRFSRLEWVGEIVTGTLTGTVAGFVGALLLPAIAPSLLIAAGGGAITGLVTSALTYPLKWLWNADVELQEERVVKFFDDESRQDEFEFSHRKISDRPRTQEGLQVREKQHGN